MRVEKCIALVLGIISAHAPATAGEKEPDLAKLEKQRCPKPAEFALVFSFGYADDKMPKDEATFGKLLKTIKEAGFNVVHCAYTEKRLELCKKHGVQMMVDLLAEEHHVFRKPEGARALCEKLRKNPDVWGYNIWNDPFGKQGEGRRRDVNNVRTWDPTHPAFCGTYRTGGMSHLGNADLMGYYDFHWKRGINQHFPHLLSYRKWCQERDAWFYTWLSATSGKAGAGNANRCLYSANTGIACGLKGILWFLGTDLMNPQTLESTQLGRDIIKVHKEISPLRKELAKIGIPSAVYSTAITRTANNDPVPDNKTALPPGLDQHAFPKDFRIEPASGEFVMGVFKDGKNDIVFVANHNAYAEQKVSLKLSREAKVSIFDRTKGEWRALEVREGAVAFPLAAAGGELLRLEK